MHATIIARRGILGVRPDSRTGLVRSACLLTAGDTHLAEDLVQTALARLYVAWPGVRRAGTESGYVWRIIVNAHIEEVRRPGRRPAALARPQRRGNRRTAEFLAGHGEEPDGEGRTSSRPAPSAAAPPNQSRASARPAKATRKIALVAWLGTQPPGYEMPKGWVVIQAPASPGWDSAELAHFASGVKVLVAAQPGAG